MALQIRDLAHQETITIIHAATNDYVVSFYNAGPNGPLVLRDSGGTIFSSAMPGEMRNSMITGNGAYDLLNTAATLGNNTIAVWGIWRVAS